jgi:two-component system alkaline phosphatase synthesis response regulator PhoP
VSRILIVEDNPNLVHGIRTSLELHGHDVEAAATGPRGLELARSYDPDLLILDLMLPELDGLRILKALRDEGREAPVLILTARGEEADKVLGFRLGADDYVTKPFSLLELLARVAALLRRGDRARLPAAVKEAEIHRFGAVEVNVASRVVTRNGAPVELTPREFDLLVGLLRRRGQVLSRPDLLREVWGHRGRVMTRTVDMHVVELRRKLEERPDDPRYILTVRKIGYRFSDDA